MTDPLFLLDRLDLDSAVVGSEVDLDGEEGRHAAVVRRLRPGERVLLGDGRGQAVRGVVARVTKSGLAAVVVERIRAPEPARRLVVAQAIAKGDRSELAVEMLTEVGVAEILPWQAARSIVRWTGERGERALGRWRSTVREAAKQSRRLVVPTVGEPVSTVRLASLAASADLALVLHEDATDSIAAVRLPDSGTVLLAVGPEGGIAREELDALTDAGARAVSISDGVLRTSTAGVVAVAGLLLR